MELIKYIEQHFNGSRTAFGDAQGVSKQQVNRWLTGDFIVIGNTLYSSRRELNLMSKTIVNFDAKTAERFPVYCKYDNQIEAQPAFISLDLRTGVIDADYSGEIGSAVPADVWARKVLRFQINPMMHKDQIESLINEYSDTFNKIMLINESEKYEELTEIEQETSDQLSGEELDSFIVDDLEDWIMNFRWPESGETLRTYVAAVAETDGEDNHYFPEKLTDLEYLKGSILVIWADWLYSGEEIPVHVAKMLLNEGTCTGSEWMDELREFAAA